MDLPDRQILDSDLEFMALYTGWEIQKCRERVIEVWRKSRNGQLHVYHCIAELMFLKTRVARHPLYSTALAALQTDPQAKWLEVGCAFGTDVRKVIVDGWSEEGMYCLDVNDGYWNLSLELFGDGPKGPNKKLNVHTVFANITEIPDAEILNVLPRGEFSVASVAAVLHVLARDDSEALLKKLFDVLLKPGGLMFGTAVGAEEPEGREWWTTPDGTNRKRFLFSVETLTRLLEDIGYVDVSVKKHKRPENAALEGGAAPRVVDANTREGRALAEKVVYLIFSAKKPNAK
jgi:SAM-dependent methyltransferase